MAQYPLANPKVIERTQQLWALNPLFLDTETTGVGEQDVVIEIGIVDRDGVQMYQSYIRSPIPIPEAAYRVHGITDAVVAASPPWKQIWQDVIAIIKTRYVVAYNSAFDLRLMRQTHQRYWMNWDVDERRFVCAMKLYAAFYGEWNSLRNSFRFHKLEEAGRQAGIALPNSHQAVDDARLTAALVKYMAAYQAAA